MKIEERDEGTPTEEHDDVVDLVTDAAGESVPSTTPASPRRRRTRRWVAFGLLGFSLIVGAFFLFEFALSSVVEARSQDVLLSQFQSLANEGPASTLGWQPAPGDPMAVLTIPRIGLQAVVIEGTSSAETTNGPAHYRGSPLPGRPGNSVIAGRRAAFGGPFDDLGALEKGDTIAVATGVGLFHYKVTSLSEIHPSQEDVLNPTPDNRLTLITSTPTYWASGRLVVTAALVGAPAKAPIRPAPVIPQDETGLTGQPWAAAPLLLWTELFLMALVGGAWLARNVSRKVAWLLAAPLAVALLWAMFMATNRLLPATL